MGTESFLGVKRPGRGVDHPPPPSAGVKERVKLHLYSPSGASWTVLGWNLPLPLTSFLTVQVLDIKKAPCLCGIFSGKSVKRVGLPDMDRRCLSQPIVLNLQDKCLRRVITYCPCNQVPWLSPGKVVIMRVTATVSFEAGMYWYPIWVSCCYSVSMRCDIHFSYVWRLSFNKPVRESVT
jgi:hypothetical protein